MPDWTNYTTGTSANDPIFYVSNIPLTAMQIEQQYAEFQERKRQEKHIMEQEWEREWQEDEKRIQQAKELEEDKCKYPLFFLKGGIV